MRSLSNFKIGPAPDPLISQKVIYNVQQLEILVCHLLWFVSASGQFWSHRISKSQKPGAPVRYNADTNPMIHAHIDHTYFLSGTHVQLYMHKAMQ